MHVLQVWRQHVWEINTTNPFRLFWRDAAYMIRIFRRVDTFLQLSSRINGEFAVTLSLFELSQGVEGTRIAQLGFGYLLAVVSTNEETNAPRALTFVVYVNSLIMLMAAMISQDWVRTIWRLPRALVCVTVPRRVPRTRRVSVPHWYLDSLFRIPDTSHVF